MEMKYIFVFLLIVRICAFIYDSSREGLGSYQNTLCTLHIALISTEFDLEHNHVHQLLLRDPPPEGRLGVWLLPPRHLSHPRHHLRSRPQPVRGEPGH